ncbi:hypothetical protein FC92_GL001810 [Liquorilactobacillus hordei DSM 19519]|uniref:Resolvase/invertase-type recombinase catalytic domain-containing protein n=1 Tax=Liquorilactobacillus hordei DSM 19519 TaxID=1423759 RepID=A0A0R1MDR3_9LACO|nr:hypothetical protein FC92_GL001810 [Liquorilactobacillus hordei DSM 19519]
MAKIGYARVSSKEQHLDRQLAALKDVDKLFTDKLSGANTNRPELQKMVDCKFNPNFWTNLSA